jgi:hypothetical protein
MESSLSRQDILRIAVECQLVTTVNSDGIYIEALERFAELVCHHYLSEGKAMTRKDIICMAGHREVTPWVMKLVQDCVDAEREACCAIVYGQCESDNVAQRTVDAIRARGDK